MYVHRCMYIDLVHFRLQQSLLCSISGTGKTNLSMISLEAAFLVNFLHNLEDNLFSSFMLLVHCHHP